jgi:hypothetical protein
MKTRIIAALIALAIVVAPSIARAEDVIEQAGVATGMSAGNMWFLPIKYLMVMPVSAFFGGLSYVVTGGNTELTEQIWQDNFQGPYIIDADLARKGIGKRPELEAKKNDSPASQTSSAEPQPVK